MIPLRSAARLRRSAVRRLRPTAPFHFDGSVFNPVHFPSQDSLWEPGRYWQTLRWNGETYGIRLRDRGTARRPEIEMALFSRGPVSSRTLEELQEEVCWRFDLMSAGVPEFVRQFRADPYVGPAIRRRTGMRPKSAYSLYEYLVITVLLQNTVIRRSISMLQTLFEVFGERVTFDGRALWGFWDPGDLDETPEETLRGLKLGYRARTLKRQAAQFARGEIDEAQLRGFQDRARVLRALDRIYGVGPQSAGYLLLEFFHFYERQPHLSPWEGTIVSRALFGRQRPSGTVHRWFSKRYGEFGELAFYYLLTDVFWEHRARSIPWLAAMIRR